jgi:hypothetical protein
MKPLEVGLGSKMIETRTSRSKAKEAKAMSIATMASCGSAAGCAERLCLSETLSIGVLRLCLIRAARGPASPVLDPNFRKGEAFPHIRRQSRVTLKALL